jgi:hypothetical protein
MQLIVELCIKMMAEEYFLDRMMKIFPLPKWIKNTDLHKKDKTKMLLLFTKKLKIREIEDLCSTFEYYGTFKKKKDDGQEEIKFVSEFLLMFDETLDGFIEEYRDKCVSLEMILPDGKAEIKQVAETNYFSRDFDDQLKYCWTKLCLYILESMYEAHAENQMEFFKLFNEILKNFVEEFKNAESIKTEIDSMHWIFISNKKIALKISTIPNRFIYMQ